jgi:hypothetical protein
VAGLVLRGVFTFLPDEVSYLFQNGLTAGQSPAQWEAYCGYISDTAESAEVWVGDFIQEGSGVSRV